VSSSLRRLLHDVLAMFTVECIDCTVCHHQQSVNTFLGEIQQVSVNHSSYLALVFKTKKRTRDFRMAVACTITGWESQRTDLTFRYFLYRQFHYLFLFRLFCQLGLVHYHRLRHLMEYPHCRYRRPYHTRSP